MISGGSGFERDRAWQYAIRIAPAALLTPNIWGAPVLGNARLPAPLPLRDLPRRGGRRRRCRHRGARTRWPSTNAPQQAIGAPASPAAALSLSRIRRSAFTTSSPRRSKISSSRPRCGSIAASAWSTRRTAWRISARRRKRSAAAANGW